VDLRNDDRRKRNLLEEVQACAIVNCSKYYVNDSNRQTTKKDAYYLLNLEGND